MKVAVLSAGYLREYNLIRPILKDIPRKHKIKSFIYCADRAGDPMSKMSENLLNIEEIYNFYKKFGDTQIEMFNYSNRKPWFVKE